jgi:predicted ATPase/DNA-binding SARP family transcriptional activator
MAAPSLFLFGKPTLDTGSKRAPFAAERPYQLLAYLACRGDWVAREVAATLFWPGRDAATARANLRFVLVQVRRLPNIAGFETRADAVRWIVETDVQRFERAVADAAWPAAVAIYRPPLLEGFDANAPSPFVEWLQFERARLTALWHNALFARLAELARDPEACSTLALRALQWDPLDETALTAHLRALSALGRHDEARRAYRDYAHRLASELAIEPSAALRDLSRQLDPRRSIVSTPNAMPASGSAGLVGRRIEIGRLKQWLEVSRAITIVGPGGVGKSALARSALAELGDGFADGAFWVPLDDLHTIGQILPRCAAAVGLQLHGTDPETQLYERLRTAHALLIFDNAEHLGDIAAWLDSLQVKCTRLRIIVTSRVRLDVAGEQTLPLAGLPAPDADEIEIAALRAFDAVRLFEQRALRVQPDFDVVANAAETAALVRAIGGLPLAIELSAAWVRLLPVAEIRRELEQSLDLLDAGENRRGRDHSVRESFEHSWRLLAPAEQRALARLAVFQGSFSRESARTVADAALPLLAALADKSLLTATGDGRFAFHPLIRQFALEKLALLGADEHRATHERHAEHFLALLGRFEAFHALDQRAALQAIGVEIENTLSAWRWAVAHRRVDLFEHCASALESYLDARGQQQFGLELLSLAGAVIDDANPAHQLARCHVQLARAAFCYRRGDYLEGEKAARAALQAARRIRYRFGVQSSTNTLSLMLWRLGRTQEAAIHMRNVLGRARADGDDAAIPLYAVNLGRIELELGNYDEGERLVRQALEGSQRNGNHAGIQAALKELCELELDHGQPRAAISLAREGLAQCESTGFRRNAPYFQCALAEAQFALSDLSSCARDARVALDAISAGGDRALEPACRVWLARTALYAGDTTAAWSQLRAAAGVAQTMQSPRAQVQVASAYAHYCMHGGDLDRARALLALAMRHPAATRRQRQSAAADLASARAIVGDAESPPAGGNIANLDQALAPLLAGRA